MKRQHFLVCLFTVFLDCRSTKLFSGNLPAMFFKIYLFKDIKLVLGKFLRKMHYNNFLFMILPDSNRFARFCMKTTQSHLGRFLRFSIANKFSLFPEKQHSFITAIPLTYMMTCIHSKTMHSLC